MRLFMLSRDGLVISWQNETSPTEQEPKLVGQSVWELFSGHPILGLIRCALGGQSASAEIEMDGRQVHAFLSPLHHPGLEGGCMGGIREIEASGDVIVREPVSDILEHISDGFLVLDHEWRYLYVNRNFEKLIKFPREKVLGRIVWSLFPTTVGSSFQEKLQEAMSDQKTVAFEYFYLPYEAWYAVRAYPTPHGLSIFFQDVTARKRAELLRRDLLLRLTTVQEDERVRLSRELHDQLGQDLTALMLGLRSLPQRSRGTDQATRIDELQAIVHHLIQQTRHVVLDLRSDSLSSQGLEVALRHYIEDWSQYHGLKVDFHSRGFDGQRVAPYIEATVYRVVQEALTNVLRHAAANVVSVLLEYRQEYILAIVEDDGLGFDVAKVLLETEALRGWGLRGMQERVELVSGSLHFESSPNAGTTVFLRVPHDDYKNNTPFVMARH